MAGVGVAAAPGQDQDKDPWGAVPARAMADPRLAATHFRVITAVATHDRLSLVRGKGAGCWASNKTLAAETGVNYTNLSTALRELGAWGYISRSHHPLNKRLHVYRINYDGLPMGKDGAPVPLDDTVCLQANQCLPTGKLKTDHAPTNERAKAPDDLPIGKESREMVCPEKNIIEQNQGDGHVEYIPLKRKDILQKQETYSPEGAPPLRIGGTAVRQSCRNPGATLAMIERALGDGGNWDRSTEQAVQKIFDESEGNSPIQHQATRILETWGSANAA